IMPGKLHVHNWILEYEYGYIFDLWEGKYTLLRLKKIGLSKYLRSFILYVIIQHAATLIQFDCYGDPVDTMPIFEWK
ncbi:hypothetical protein J1782_00435, partial [Rahnella sp. BCC 1045]|uniref:DUF5983 family protein n=1 Tax=Rahnella sp. BCC 1045 TaxID=2816251 RepID=UPI001C25B424